MKKSYSLILLVSFLIGALQPVLPMIEYQLFRGSIIELLADEDCNREKPVKILTLVPDEDCRTKDNLVRSLLDTDYYPLAVQIIPVPNASVYFHISTLYSPQVQKIASRSYLPTSPPPQVS